VYFFFLCLDDKAALEQAEKEYLQKKATDEQQATITGSQRNKRQKRTGKDLNKIASEKEVQLALGLKPVVPQQHQKASSNIQKQNRVAKKALLVTQTNLDQKILKKHAPNPVNADDAVKDILANEESDSDDQVVNNVEAIPEENSQQGSMMAKCLHTCPCVVCRALSKYGKSFSSFNSPYFGKVPNCCNIIFRQSI